MKANLPSPRVLILISHRSYKAEAFLQAAERLGLQTTIGSDRRQALATANPAGNLALDFAHPARAVEQIVSFAAQFPLSGIVAADDDGVEIAAMALARLGLPHNPLAALRSVRNKYLFRKRLAGTSFDIPFFRRFPLRQAPEEAAAQVPYPCVLKPLFLSASQGVIRADDAQQFVLAFNRIRNLLHHPENRAAGGDSANSLLVESYLPGQEVAVEGLLHRGELQILAIFDKPDPMEGPYFEETLYVTPSRLPAAVQSRLGATLAEALRHLGLREGPVHAEFRLDGENIHFLEIASRSIGGLCSRVLRFDGGATLEELILLQAIGADVRDRKREQCAAGVMMLPIPRAGILLEVQGLEAAREIAEIEEVRITIPRGQPVVPLPEGNRYLGFLFARAARHDEVDRALRRAFARLQIYIEPSKTLTAD